MADVPEADGKVEKSGKTDTARAGSVLHDHAFNVAVKVDEAGKIVFEGKTGPASQGPEHDHPINAMAAEGDESEYVIETEDGSDGSEGHLMRVKLPKVMTTPSESAQYTMNWTDTVTNTSSAGTPVEFLEYITMTNPSTNTYTIKFANAPNIITSKKTESDSEIENGLICFSEGFDGRRHYQDSMLAFSASLPREGGAHGKIRLEPDGRLKQMVFRTGTFVHPKHGPITSDDTRLNNIQRNFTMDVLGQKLPVNIHHKNELGALGFHDELKIEPHTFITKRGDGKKIEVPGKALWSYVQPTPFGYRELVEDQKYHYASAELMWELHGRERFDFVDGFKKDRHLAGDEYGTMAVYRDLLCGSAATNTPFIPRLKSFAASAEDVMDAYNAILKKYSDPREARKHAVAELNRRGIW